MRPPAVVNNSRKKSRNENRDDIDGNINVPDVFMRTKYGSISQYNYEIKDQHDHHVYNEKPTPSKPPIEPSSKRQTPASIVKLNFLVETNQ